jgi:hypothetical protein
MIFFVIPGIKYFYAMVYKIPHFPPLENAYKLLICQEYKRIFVFYARNIYQRFRGIYVYIKNL